MLSESFYPIAKKDSLVRWRDELKDTVGLEMDPPESYQLSFCDSFDWRLFAAGLCLDCLVGPQQARLVLTGIDEHSPVVEQMLSGAAVRFASDLPDGTMKSRLSPLLDMRAFLPLATLSVHSYCLRRENKEGKTLARVYIESFSTITKDGHARMVEKRLRLQPLRGYEKASQGIARKLEKRYKLVADSDDLRDRAYTIAGRHPGDYSGKLKVRLEPRMRADAAVRVVLGDLFAAMQVNELGTIEDLDSEFLHDFRVAVRRTRSALGELKGVFPLATLKRFKREFAWLGGVTSNLRDLDVYLLKFDSLQAALPKSRREGLEPLRGFLRYKQQKEQAEILAPELQGRRYKKLKLQWQRYLETPLAKRPTATDAAKPVAEYASRRIWRMYKRVMREGGAITDESPPPELHELRKSCKKLRYLMEFFQSLYPPKTIRVLIKELKQLQENLGDFQDIDVQVGAMERFSMEMRRRGEFNAATAESMAALLTILREQEAVVRGEFHARFERFAQQGTRAQFKVLFKPESTRAVE